MNVNDNSKSPILQQACDVLNKFKIGDRNEIIEFDSKKNIKIGTRACWLSRVVRLILRFFSCGTHPVEKVARRLMDIFTKNQEHVNQTHANAINKLSFFIGKSQVSIKTKTRFDRFMKDIKLNRVKSFTH